MIRRDSGSAAPTPGTYVWSIPEKGISIEISLDAVDRLLQDVMRGFGAVPRRGAEVGGVLLGSLRRDGELVVHVQDFELVTIEYRRGPSFLLSGADETAFAEAVVRARSNSDAALRPVGFFRSNTRDSVGLAQEDLDFIEKHFPEPDAVALMIKPYGTRVSMAGFYVREDGKFPLGVAPAHEFPFRRKELAPDETQPEPARRPERAVVRPITPTPIRPEPEPPPQRAMVQQSAPADPAPFSVPTFASLPSYSPSIGKSRVGALWMPVSLLFLLLGLLLGFLATQALRPGPAPADPFRLKLKVTASEESLNVKWDRESYAIRNAQRGLLTIDDGAYSKIVDLDAMQLHNGSVVYRHDSSEVKFRLEVFPADRTSVAETLEWRRPAR